MRWFPLFLRGGPALLLLFSVHALQQPSFRTASRFMAAIGGHAASAGQRPPGATRPTYLILIDVDSLDYDDTQKACVVAGTVVDGLDPDDLGAILAVSGGPTAAQATTNRLAARRSLESILSRTRAANEPRQGSWSLAETIQWLVNATKQPGGVRRAIATEDMAKRAWTFVRAAPSRLTPVTTDLLTTMRDSAPRLVVIWFTNYPDAGDAEASRGTDILLQAAAAARASISIVVPGNGARRTYYEGYRHVALATGGAFVSGGGADGAAKALLTATAGAEPRRRDPAAASELTSLRRCAERAGQQSEYVPLVEQYRAGDAGRAVSRLASWPPGRLASDVLPLPSLADLEAAVALHTEVGIQRGVAPRVHLGIAQRAAEAIWSRQPGNAVCRQWVFTMAAYERETIRGLAFVTGADPPVLVALGSALELPLSLEAEPSLTRAYPPTTDLSRAAEMYRSALAVDPRLTEARVRLGRVLGILQQRQEAIAELERARSEARDPRFVYLASLFLGDIHEAAHNEQAAVLAYRTAVKACPDAQAARIALARLLESSGQHVEANEVIREQFAARSSGREGWNLQGHSSPRDPWQDYYHGSLEDLARELAALREAARK